MQDASGCLFFSVELLVCRWCWVNDECTRVSHVLICWQLFLNCWWSSFLLPFPRPSVSAPFTSKNTEPKHPVLLCIFMEWVWWERKVYKTKHIINFKRSFMCLVYHSLFLTVSTFPSYLIGILLHDQGRCIIPNPHWIVGDKLQLISRSSYCMTTQNLYQQFILVS
jgi:hypothetical protein